LIGLIGPKLCGRRLGEDVFRDEIDASDRIAPATKAIDLGLKNVFEHGVRAGHIAVQRAIADCGL
jgi:hypothetical protein